MNRTLSLALLSLLAMLAACGCCSGGSGGSCSERATCCAAIETAESNSTVAYIRGACRVNITGASLCSRSLDTIHERIQRTPSDAVPESCRP